MTRVSPKPEKYPMEVSEFGATDWDDDNDYNNKSKENGHVNNRRRRPDTTESTVRRRRRRSFEPGSDEYASYVEKRVFNKRQAWTPYLWERKRDKRMLGNLNPTKGWKGWKYRQKMRWNSFKLTWREFTDSMEIWRDSLKRIEGFQGTGVVSYFVFLKFLLFLNIFIFLSVFWVVIFFQTAFDSADFSKETTGYDNVILHEGLAISENCTQQYHVNDTSGFQVVLDLIQGTGWMEKTVFFYGYYSNKEVTIPSGTYNIPFAYLMVTLVILVVSLIVMVHHTFTKYTDTIVASEKSSSKTPTFFISVCCGWDYRINGDKPVLFQHKNMYHRLFGDLEDLKHELEKQRQSRGRRCCLWFTRIFTSENDSNDYNMMIILFVQYLPSTIIAAINAIYPILFMLVVKLEKYRPSFVIKITILRIVFVRLAALVVISLTIYTDVTCSPSDQCNVGTGRCAKIQCWETYFGQQIYKFFVTEFFVDIALTFLYELPRKLLTTKLDYSLAKKIGPAEFDIAINVLDLVYGQALCWLGFFFVPILPALTVIRLIVLFYLKMLSALYNTVPAEKPYQAARSNAFFMITLLITFFLVSIPMGYVLVELEPSPMCGPFRIYHKPTDILDIQINLSASWFQTTWIIVTSTAFISAIILILGLALYYCSALKSANKSTIALLKGQIMQDEKDKQYLLLQLSKYTGEGNTDSNNVSEPPSYRQSNQQNKVAQSGFNSNQHKAQSGYNNNNNNQSGISNQHVAQSGYSSNQQTVTHAGINNNQATLPGYSSTKPLNVNTVTHVSETRQDKVVSTVSYEDDW
ncbi:TMC domain [Mactra antiquata]